MMFSARNQLKGTIKSVTEGAVNSMVALETEGGDLITSTITLDAVKELELATGKEAYAIIKSTEVMIGVGELKLSARNQFTGKIDTITEGAVNAVVTLTTKGGSKFSSIISLAAVKDLELTVGSSATAVIKATSVMIGI